MIRLDDPRRRQSDRLDWRYLLRVIFDGATLFMVAYLLVVGTLVMLAESGT